MHTLLRQEQLGQQECNSGDIRLVGGDRESEGRVEVCVEGFWGTVCDSSWGQREALVVCKQSGYGARGKNAFCFLVITTYELQAGSNFFFNCRSNTSEWCLFWRRQWPSS